MTMIGVTALALIVGFTAGYIVSGLVSATSRDGASDFDDDP